MKTHSIKQSDLEKQWIEVDAEGQVLGRLASRIAHILRGKHKPSFVPHLDCGDNVVVINAEKVLLTGRKWEQKKYYHHTGYIGGIKEISAQKLKEKHPNRLLEKAVKGMLPHNKLGRKILGNLRVYTGPEHQHKAQKPKVLELSPKRVEKE